MESTANQKPSTIGIIYILKYIYTFFCLLEFLSRKFNVLYI